MGEYAVAQLALLLWLPVSALAFSVLRPAQAAAVVFLGGALLLPEKVGFDFPGLPALAKMQITGLCVLVGAALRAPRRLLTARLGRGPDLVVFALLLGDCVTALTNGDPMRTILGPAYRLTSYDALSMMVRDLLLLGFPFVVGRAIYRSARDLRDLLVLLVASALGYSLLILIELRLSPQLHHWVYGYHQTDFAEAYRLWGYRPMVFLSTGLSLGLFVCVSAIAATTLACARIRVFSLPSGAAASYLSLILVLSKSLAALIYGAATIPLLMLSSPRLARIVLLLLSGIVAGYPLLRAAELFPDDQLTSIATTVSGERAQSLEFRFENEQQLMAHAVERLWFGWGEGGRSHIYDEWGGDLSTTDGFWIIWFGTRGLVGWAAAFSLLLLPIWRACFRLKRIPERRVRILVIGLASAVTVYAVDLLPNGLFTNLPLFLSGALYGVVGTLSAPRRANRVAAPRSVPEGRSAEPAPPQLPARSERPLSSQQRS